MNWTAKHATTTWPRGQNYHKHWLEMAANSTCRALTFHWKSSNDTGSKWKPLQRSRIYAGWINFLLQHCRSRRGGFSNDFGDFNIFMFVFSLKKKKEQPRKNNIKDARQQFLSLESCRSKVPCWDFHYPIYKIQRQFKPSTQAELLQFWKNRDLSSRWPEAVSAKECNFWGKDRVPSKVSILSIGRLLICVLCATAFPDMQMGSPFSWGDNFALFADVFTFHWNLQESQELDSCGFQLALICLWLVLFKYLDE